MKILILHFSDIHLKADSDIIFQRVVKIFDATKNHTSTVERVFILLSGDITYSGREDEFNLGIKFIDALKRSLEKYSSLPIDIFLSPGNHDCDFDIPNKLIRQKLIKDIHQDGSKAIYEGVLETCLKVQNSYFTFEEMYLNKAYLFYDNKLLKSFKLSIKNFNVIIHCYNSSWISELKEQPGKLFFPLNQLDNEIFKDIKADLIISIIHHPFNWYEPINSNELKNHIERTSDIIITGHEHVESLREIHDFDNNYTEYFAGDVLQDKENSEYSGFNLFVLDLEEKKQKFIHYIWDNNLYNIADKKNDIPFKRSKFTNKNVFTINSDFYKYLTDPGASYFHPKKEKLYLQDIFVPPNLRKVIVSNSMKMDNEIISTDSLFIHDFPGKLIINGADKSGKTTLIKALYIQYHEYDYVPIFIEGQRINSSTIEKFNKLIDQTYINQFSEESLIHFQQLDNSKKIIFIDEFQRTKINIRYRANLISNIDKVYPNIIIFVNDLFQIEEIVSDEDRTVSTFREYKKYQLIEFGHFLRDKLIGKWNILGQDEIIEEKDLIHKNDIAKGIVDTIIGKNFVPSFPIFLLTILQTIEAGRPHDLRESAFGHYYQYLIIQALSRIKKKNDEIEAFYSYVTELSYSFFEKKVREISYEEFYKFHSWYCNDAYKISPSFTSLLNFDTLIENLISSDIIREINGLYSFRYKYVFYFFVAKYIANNLGDSKVKKIVSKICKRLYYEEFANIIMFLTHHTKDPFILDEVLKNSVSIFSDIEPIKFNDDIKCVNDLLDEIPKFMYEEKDVQENREQILKLQDSTDIRKIENPEEEELDYNLEEDIHLDIVSHINLAFKTIEILGQILKNYYGSLKANKRFVLGQEAISLGLRSLNVFFSLLRDYKHTIVGEIKDMIKSENILDDREKEELAKKLLFSLCELISFGFVKKISNSIGYEKLSETFKEIIEKNDTLAVNLVDISIKLDHFKGFPYSSIEALQKRTTQNFMPNLILQRLVVNYLYMFPTNDREKQKICSKVGISVGEQRAIDSKSVQKKR